MDESLIHLRSHKINMIKIPFIICKFPSKESFRWTFFSLFLLIFFLFTSGFGQKKFFIEGIKKGIERNMQHSILIREIHWLFFLLKFVSTKNFFFLRLLNAVKNLFLRRDFISTKKKLIIKWDFATGFWLNYEDKRICNLVKTIECRCSLFYTDLKSTEPNKNENKIKMKNEEEIFIKLELWYSRIKCLRSSISASNNKLSYWNFIRNSLHRTYYFRKKK